MFTGIITHLGRVQSAGRRPGGLRLILEVGELAAELRAGDSLAVSGACLTVVSVEDGRAVFDLSEETLGKTWLGSAAPGRRVNLERSLRVGDSLGGHFVTGHVDGVGRVVEIQTSGGFAVHTYQAPAEIRRWLVPKGSVAVEGVSLTVAELSPDGRFKVSLIPETLMRTTLASLLPGDPVHLEGDLIGKYVQRHLDARCSGS